MGQLCARRRQITIYKILTEKPVGNKGKVNWYVIDGSFMNDLIDTGTIHQNGTWYRLTIWTSASWIKSVWPALLRQWWQIYRRGEYILLPRLADCDELYVALMDTGAYQDSLGLAPLLLSSPAKLIAKTGK